MLVGKVVGTIVSTRKNEKLVGSKFMVIEPIEKLGNPNKKEVASHFVRIPLLFTHLKKQILSDYITHIIHARRLACQEFCCLEGAVSEDCFGVGGVLDFDNFVGACEDDFVFAYNGTAAYCGDSDFLLLTHLALLGTVEFVRILVV